jgi:hypothetical protein
MKYFIDFEFSEGFHKPMFGKRRHHIDLISVAVVNEIGESYYAISNEYRYDDCNTWVKENVLLPMYQQTVHGDFRNRYGINTFHKAYGKSNETIKLELLNFFGCWRDNISYRTSDDIQVYGYYADYDWVLLCSIFGRMVDLPRGFPKHCIDLKQMYDDKKDPNIKNRWDYPKNKGEHNALADAQWNKKLYEYLMNIDGEKAKSAL